MHRTATPTAPQSDLDSGIIRDGARAALTNAMTSFTRGHLADARSALVDARAMVQELINRTPEDDTLHAAYNGIGTAGMLVDPITPQYAQFALDKLTA